MSWFSHTRINSRPSESRVDYGHLFLNYNSWLSPAPRPAPRPWRATCSPKALRYRLDLQAHISDLPDRIHDHKINRIDGLLPGTKAELVARASAPAAVVAREAAAADVRANLINALSHPRSRRRTCRITVPPTVTRYPRCSAPSQGHQGPFKSAACPPSFMVDTILPFYPIVSWVEIRAYVQSSAFRMLRRCTTGGGAAALGSAPGYILSCCSSSDAGSQFSASANRPSARIVGFLVPRSKSLT